MLSRYGNFYNVKFSLEVHKANSINIKNIMMSYLKKEHSQLKFFDIK